MSDQPVLAPSVVQEIDDRADTVEQPKTFQIESRTFEYVPASERFGTVSDQRKFWFMANATLITVYAGVVGPDLGLGLVWTVVAIVIGSLIGTIFQALHAAQGPVMGLPQMIQSRVQFGSRGALIPLLAAVLVLGGFPLFSIQTGAAALTDISPANSSVSQLIVGGLGALITIFGFRLVLRTEKVLSYLSCMNFLLLTGAAAYFVPWHAAFSHSGDFATTAFVAQIGASATVQLGIAPYVSDFTRYLPRDTSKPAITAAVFGGTCISAVWLSVLGSVVTVADPDSDPIAALRHLGDRTGFGLGTITLAIAVPAAMLVAASGFYSATISLLSGAEAFRSFRTTKRLRAVVITVIGMVVVAAGLLLPSDTATNFQYFLTIMGYLLVPWTAVNLIDFYLIRREIYSVTDILRPDGGIYGHWSRDGLVSYLIGFLAMVPFFSTPLYEGPAAQALDGTDVAFAVGLVVASACYLALSRGFDRCAYVTRVAEAEINTLAG